MSPEESKKLLERMVENGISLRDARLIIKESERAELTEDDKRE
jgi:hypothetical protein